MATIDRLRKRAGKLRQELQALELEIAALERVPTQEGFSGMPPPTPTQRKPSVNEENFAEFQGTRRTRLEKLGVDFVPDEKQQPAFINVRMKTIRDACRDDDELFALFTRFMSEDWSARCTPPYPFTAFAADKTWTRLLAEHRGEPVAVALRARRYG